MAYIIIGKIKGKPDVFWATIGINKIKDLNYRQRVETTGLLNLTYLEFLLCTKEPSNNTININKNEFNKLIKLNTKSYIDWAVIEPINSITIKENKITTKENKITITITITINNNNDDNNKIEITIDNNAITIGQNKTKTQALEALRELIDFWK